MKRILLFGLCGLFFTQTAHAFETTAPYALLMDADTGYVMLDKKADVKMAPASMSKLMTAYLVFDALKSGRISEEDEFIVSENAWRKGGAKSGSSTMFLNPREKVKVKDLIRGIIVQSGNDACITVAENLAGSEDVFADMMTKKGKELGLKNATFKNATGLPHPEHKMTSEDLALLAQAIIRDFPEYYPIYSQKEFTYNKIKQFNRNPLLYHVKGADGLKTGHTKESGYGLTGSVKTPDGRRLILVLNGLKTEKDRMVESQKVAGYGISAFTNIVLFQENTPIVEIPVWLGVQETVAAVSLKEIHMTLMKGTEKDVKARVVYEEPLMAPIQKGQEIARLIIEIPDRPDETIPLVAAQSIEKTGWFGKIKAVLKSWGRS